MKCKLVLLSLIVLAGACHSVRAENTAAVNDVLKLKSAGVTEETIVSYIQSKNVNYDLSADTVLALRAKGVTPAVLNAMLASGNAGAAAATAPVSAWSQPQPGITPPPPLTPQPQPPQPASPMPNPAAAPPPPGYPGVPAPQVVQPMANPDVAYFYQELSPYGRWMLAEDGQWCWQPTVAVSAPLWRPYWDKGHWIWTDHGWYWSSDYPWGWAAFHYGRWQLHPHHGWVWYPDHVWGPSWVVWRGGGQYCGWAPLPPGAVYDTVHGYFTYHGNHVEAGFDFGLGFAHFSFCYTSQMGHPAQPHGWNETEAHQAYNRTTIINNYSVQRSVVGGETQVRVVNHGLEPSKFAEAKGRSPEPVHIEELRTPAPGRAHERMDAQGGTLQVYRPKFGDRQPQGHGDKPKESSKPAF
jgi:hypothetical protein